PATPSVPPSMANEEPAAAPHGPSGGELAAKGLPSAPVAPAEDEEHAMPNDGIHSGLKGNKPADPSGHVGPSGTDWSGGDAELGKRQFGNQCARCHGLDGKGGTVAGVGAVPSLQDPEFHKRNGD